MDENSFAETIQAVILRSANVVPNHLVTDFRHVLRLRHWYAHGRHWLLRTNATEDPQAVHAISRDLLAALPPL